MDSKELLAKVVSEIAEAHTKSEEIRVKLILEADVFSSQNPSREVRVHCREALESPEERVVESGHVIADGDERHAGRPRADEAEKSVGVAN